MDATIIDFSHEEPELQESCRKVHEMFIATNKVSPIYGCLLSEADPEKEQTLCMSFSDFRLKGNRLVARFETWDTPEGEHVRKLYMRDQLEIRIVGRIDAPPDPENPNNLRLRSVQIVRINAIRKAH